MRALIIDDDPVCSKLLEKALAPHASVSLTPSGAQGLQAFRRALEQDAPFDLAFIDIMMPDMDGHQALSLMRRLEADRGVAQADTVKAFVVSSASDSKNINRAFFEGGALSYLCKPVEIDQIRKELERFGII